MKILLFSDLHLHSSWLDRSVKFLKWLTKQIHHHKPDYVFFLGDVFEEKDRILNKLKKILISFISQPNFPPFLWLIGNHDFSTNEATTIEFLENVIKEPQIVEFGGKSFLFLPYGTTHPYVEDVDYICLHDAVEGTALPSGFTFRCGITLDYLKQYNPKKIFAGHIHIPMNNGWFYYLGSPIERDFRDGFIGGITPVERGVYLLDTETDEVSLLEYKDLRFLHIKVSSKDEFVNAINLINQRFIDNGYPVALWVEQLTDFELPEFDKSIFFSFIRAKPVEEAPEVVVEKQLADLKQVINKFVPRKYKKDETFWSYGEKIFQKVGIDL